VFRRRWFAAAALAAPFLTAIVASCAAGGGNPFGAYVLPQALPSPVLGYGSFLFSIDGQPRRFERAVIFTPGGGKVGMRPDEIGPQQRKDIFIDEVTGQQLTFRFDVPGLGGPGPVATGATLEITDQRSTPPLTYRGPVSVFLQQAGARRGLPVMGTFSGTLPAVDVPGKQVSITDGQFYGHLATDV
jgi:hypothetical protein